MFRDVISLVFIGLLAIFGWLIIALSVFEFLQLESFGLTFYGVGAIFDKSVVLAVVLRSLIVFFGVIGYLLLSISINKYKGLKENKKSKSKNRRPESTTNLKLKVDKPIVENKRDISDIKYTPNFSKKKKTKIIPHLIVDNKNGAKINLTKDEFSFLRSQDLSVEDVFDCLGMTTKHWKNEIRKQGHILALGNPCKKAGHRLRTRSGHCVQCDPKKIAYQNRYHKYGYVYIATSCIENVIKIGTAINIDQREENLNRQEYGGISDWTMQYHIKCSNAGKIEHEIMLILASYRSTRGYDKDGVNQSAQEIFKCPVSKAYDAFTTVIKRFDI